MKALEDTVEKLNKDLVKNAAATKKAGRAAATASGNVQRLGIAFRTTFAPITAIVGSLALLSKALNTTGQRGADLNVISSSLNGLVDNADAAATALLDASDKLGKATLFDQEDFTETFKLFTSFRNIGVDSYERVGEAAADIATKLGTRPKEAALQLAKALEDPAKQVTALARSGTVFTEQQKEQIKALQASGDLLGAQEVILKEIEAQYGGAAKAAGAAGFAGALDSAGEAWRDFLEALGQSSESSAVGFLNAIANGLNFLTANFDVISAAASAAADVIVQPFVALYEGIKSVTGPVDNFREQFRGALAIITKLLTDLTKNVLTPVFKFIGKIIGGIIQLLAGLLRNLGTFAFRAVQTVTGALRKIAEAVETFINSTPAGLLSKLFGLDAGAAAAAGIRNFASGLESLASKAQDYASELTAAADAANALADAQGALDSSNPFAGAGPKGAINQPGAKGGGASKTNKLTDAEKELAKQLKITQKLVDGVNQAYARRDSAIGSVKEEIEYLQIAIDKGEEWAQKFREVKRLVMEGVGFNEAFDLVTQRDALEKQLEGTKKLNEEMSTTEELARGVADIFANSMQDAVKGLINGTKSLNDVMSDMLSKLADLFLNMAFSQLGGGLGNLFTDLVKGRAVGGPVNAGEPYLVGEQGPELVVPAASGNVISSDAFADATRALASGGGAVSGDGTDGTSAAFAAAAGANQVTNNNRTMMRSERFHSEQAAQMANPSPIKVSYESTVINNQSYVTEEQFQKGMTQTANRARNQTMRDFRNKPASRKMAGVN